MKIKIQLIVIAVVAAISSDICSAAIQVPLPEFRSKAELQRTTQKSLRTLPEKGTFYTGKPFEIARDGYLFKYRNYSPELNRWTSIDPSGFPDGANSWTYVSNKITTHIDDAGLKDKSIAWVYWDGSFSGNPVEIININIGIVTKEMNTADSKGTDADGDGIKETPAYLSDGDIFASSVIVADSVNTIIGAAQNYDCVLFLSHGWYNGQDYYWGLASPPYHSVGEFGSELEKIVFASCYNGYSPTGINGAQGAVSVASLILSMRDYTKSYLYE